MEQTRQRLITLFGTAKPAAAYRLLRAGQLEARLECGNLRYVRFDGEEVLRAVGYVVRDRDWGTCEPKIANLSVDEGSEGFRVSYDATCLSAGVVLRYRAEIEGSSDGRLRFAAVAEPDDDFVTNRCGFTVLHPIEGVAGAAVTVEHVDGTREDARLPASIAPWQPLKEIRTLSHRVAGRFRATCRLEGDTFEMEDHRNWSDASFKTYVRPIEKPWPYVMPAGRPDSQSVSLSIEPLGSAARLGAAAAPDRMGGSVTVEVSPAEGSTGRHPAIGLVVAPEELPDAIANVAKLRAVGPQVVLCHFDPTAGHDAADIAAFAALQRLFPASYQLECVVPAEGSLTAELASVAEAARQAGLRLSSLSVCPSVDRQSTPPGSKWPDCPPLADVYAAARAAFPGIPLGGGMVSYFTELNRKRPPVGLLDFVTHATCPIVHAADDESVMETLEALPHITRSARTIIGDKPYHIGPSTIAMRQNPYGSQTMENPDRDRICMADNDPRHFGLFGSAWTLGYAAAVVDGSPAQLVPAAAVGPRGLISITNSTGGWSRNPLFHVVHWLAQIAGRAALPCSSSDPRRVAATAAVSEDGTSVLVANLTPHPIELKVDGSETSTAEVLDCAGWRNTEPSTRQEFWKGSTGELDAYAVALLRPTWIGKC